MDDHAPEILNSPSATDQHAALHDFIGDWALSQKLWSHASETPIEYRGTSKCVSVHGGIATLMTTQVPATGFVGTALMTYSRQDQRYEMAWSDNLSDTGILVMNGQARQAPSRHELRAEFGDDAVQAREWGVVIRLAPASHDTTDDGAVEANMGLRVVENKVSDDRWVQEFFAVGADGASKLLQQNIFDRIK